MTAVGFVLKAIDKQDTETYDNGKKVVPSFLLEPEAVNIDNYKELLVDSGYYSEEEISK